MPLIAWNEIALKTGEMMLASAQVIGHRTHRMAKAGAIPNARDQREFTLMGQEKLEAASESAMAMGRQIANAHSRLGMRAWQDMMAAGSAMMSLATSRSITDAMTGHARLANTVTRSAASAGELSDVAAKLVNHGMKPIHSRATANARRLGRR
jgi:hypothetical protein